MRRFLTRVSARRRDAVRIEEMVNYFRVRLPASPKGDAPFSVTTEVAVARGQPEHRLVRVGIKGKSLRDRCRAGQQSRLPDRRLGLDAAAQQAAAREAGVPAAGRRSCAPQDRVAIVVYAGAAGWCCPPPPARTRRRSSQALDRLEAGGSTAGGAGIRLAYEIARQHFVRGGNNRVILATDGDFNVGVSSATAAWSA